MLFETGEAVVEELNDDLFDDKGVQVFVLRLDKIHPVISGNKLFKLHYFLEEAISKGPKKILTFGGAYSNHLAATAYMCRLLNLPSIGVVRGERPAELSHTLMQCQADDMELCFVSREEYQNKEHSDFIKKLQSEYGDFLLIPEGGFHPLGALGASLIPTLIEQDKYTHICTAVGTATTLAGLAMAAMPHQQVVAVPVLKGLHDLPERLKLLTGMNKLQQNLSIMNNYHFGGYAKRSDDLLNFMNACWIKYRLPLDFVYTAKMLFAVTDAVKKELFKKESKILCLHTGGLQGNKSLPLNLLKF